MKHVLALLVLLVTSVALAPSALAQTLYTLEDPAVPLAVHAPSGLLFVGKDKAVYRVYSWKQSDGAQQNALFVTDLDKDGKKEFVGAGKPTFALRPNSDPWWFAKGGCSQVLVADFSADEKRDVLCLKNKNVEIYTHDHQLIWSISIGKRFDWCQAGDVNGDLKADIECKLRGSKNFTRFDGQNGEVLAASTDASEISEPVVSTAEPVGKEALQGKGEWDLDQDGTAEESLLADGKAVAVRSRSRKKGLARIELDAEPLAATVQDVDGDKKPEVVILTKNALVIASPDGKEVQKLGLNTRKYKREPVADLESVYANGFEDDAAAKKVVEDLNAELARCYSSQVRKNQFAGTGQALLEVSVGKNGKASKVQKHHSSLADQSVVACAQKVLKKGKYPKASGESASINVTMTYTFRDR